MDHRPRQPYRRSVRLRGYDYSQPGTYFVTICTHDRACLFGTIAKGIMVRNEIGDLVAEEWLRSAVLRPELVLDEWVVMPNHLHALVGIMGNLTLDDERAERTHGRASLHRAPRSLSSFVGGFKSSATTWINHLRGTPRAPVWQPRFYDHIVRTNDALDRVREYIHTNPERWSADAENPSGDGTDHFAAFVESLDAPVPPRRDARPCVRPRLGGSPHA